MQATSRIFLFSPYLRSISALLLTFSLAGCATSQTVKIPVPAPSAVVALFIESEDADVGRKFARWVTDFKSSARAKGINDLTLDIAFDNVQFLPKVIELDRSQPEFTRPVWEYLDSALSKQRIELGKNKLKQLRPQVEGLLARYGVPVEVLVAIWGIESNYGSHMGDIPTIDALATLGFEGRRADWAAAQLLAALKILQNGDVERPQMIGSWAGAMGQTQFLPSVYLAYAVDADGDGRRNIWGSLPDVMASTANYLAHSGWQSGQPLGFEVRLPRSFDYALSDVDVRQSASRWEIEGVRGVDGESLPSMQDASILLPAGARGPAFLVGANFRTILRYNNATSYALAVNLLAQRLMSEPVIQIQWPREMKLLNRSQLINLQTALNSKGFDTGKPDGIMGPATQRGVRLFQRSLGLVADGYPTLELLQKLY